MSVACQGYANFMVIVQSFYLILWQRRENNELPPYISIGRHLNKNIAVDDKISHSFVPAHPILVFVHYFWGSSEQILYFHILIVFQHHPKQLHQLFNDDVFI